MSIDLPIVRVYENAEAAERAVRSLRRWGFEEERISRIALPAATDPAAGRSFDEPRWLDALHTAAVPRSQWPSCLGALRKGQVLLTVRAPFGTGGIAEDMLDEAAPVRHAIEPYRRPLLPSHWAAPFSRILGLPVLVRSGRTTSDAPGLPTVTRPGRTTSEALGLPTLVRRRRFILGEPRLHHDAAPFSRLFRLPVLTRRGRTVGEAIGLPETARSRPFVFGAPRLFHSPAPFSRLFGLPVLVRRDRRGELQAARPDERDRRVVGTPVGREMSMPPRSVPRPREAITEDVVEAR